MSGRLLDGLHLTLGPEQFEALVDAVAERIEDRLPSSVEVEDWFDVEAAASYLACRPDRIYDLKQQGRLDYRNEGRRLLFRREWLDALLVGGLSVVDQQQQG